MKFTTINPATGELVIGLQREFGDELTGGRIDRNETHRPLLTGQRAGWGSRTVR